MSSYSQTQLENNEKSWDQYKKVDALLNSTYNQLTFLLKGKKEKALLIKAQKMWILFRDAHCSYTESFYEGGSMQSSVYSDCLRLTTEVRLKELKIALREMEK